eukprot:2330513-Prymnesium_polylepis.1
MLGGSLSISCSKCAQKAADRLPQSTRSSGERARPEVVCARWLANEGTQGFEPPGDSDVAPG